MRTNWSKQSDRLWNYLVQWPNQDLSAVELDTVAAGLNGTYTRSFSKRISECRAKAKAQGMDLILSRDERHGTQRRTWYKLVKP